MMVLKLNITNRPTYSLVVRWMRYHGVREIGGSEERNHLSEGCVKIVMVELRGIEPLTS